MTRLLRILTATLLTAGLLATPGASALAASRTVEPDQEVVSANLVNGERSSRGLGALETNLQLVRIARAHSEAMARDDDNGGACGDSGTLRHRSPLDGGITQYWTNLRENVACGPDAESLHTALMQSHGHRSNILADDVEFIGVGAVRSADGTLWITQIFMLGGDHATTATVDEGIAASQLTFPAAGSAGFAVVSRSDVFADSLGGAALAGGHAPVLFTDAPTASEPQPVLRPTVAAELLRVLPPGATVYVLGGTAAVSDRTAADLASLGFAVRRLAGSDRFATATAIAQEVVARYGTPDRVAVAFGGNWPDAVTGGAAAARGGYPVVLVRRDEVPASTAAFLRTVPAGADRVVLGGTSVISEGVRAQLGARRVAGGARTSTALAVATDLFGSTGDEVIVLHGWNADSWARALALASYAAEHGAPQLLVSDELPGDTADYLSGRHVTPLFGSAVPGHVRDQVRTATAS